jgi:hypothetical protein
MVFGISKKSCEHILNVRKDMLQKLQDMKNVKKWALTGLRYGSA